MNKFEWVISQFKKLSFDTFIQTWKKAFIIDGTASRHEFWNFQIFMGATSILSLSITALLGLNFLFYIVVLCTMASVIPSFTLAVRRCNDLELPGFLGIVVALSTFIPVIGQIIYFGAIGGLRAKSIPFSFKK